MASFFVCTRQEVFEVHRFNDRDGIRHLRKEARVGNRLYVPQLPSISLLIHKEKGKFMVTEAESGALVCDAYDKSTLHELLRRLIVKHGPAGFRASAQRHIEKYAGVQAVPAP